jgi:hypothetical protein
MVALNETALAAQKLRLKNKIWPESVFKSKYDANDTYIENISRLWERMTNFSWCCERVDYETGLIYVKVPKTGSSTLAGINIRIAKHVGRRMGLKKGICTHTYKHGRQYFLKRQKPNLVWSFIRDPAKRAMSEFYHFSVSRGNETATDESLATFLTRHSKSFQFKYLVDHELGEHVARHRKRAKQAIEQYIMHSYDFIGLTERKDESLAVMKLLWNLEDKDMIVLSAKQSGGYDDGQYQKTCFQIQKPNTVSAHVNNILKTEFVMGNHDYLLYAIVNRSLDKTVERLGRDRVQKEIERLNALQQYAEAHCQNQAIFPCSANGTYQPKASKNNCYHTDSGCGYPCVDRVLADYPDPQNQT